ncbi:hypothetical protein PIB30_026318 [Stylosanthes scabra]|uniref:Ubiquitin-like protease family profile domain-containing protein n=1 Tax=Stylosanthes scabra TaxID=79078 RepID=A0ABU6X9Z4_9FABA|nr:hypothetical protein [Stylosanthes scabra]
MTSAISSLAKILEIRSSTSARFFTQESITSTLNTKSTLGSSLNILNGDMNINVKKLIHVNEDTIEHHIKKQSNNDHENSESKAIMQKWVKPDEYDLNKLGMPSQTRHDDINAKSTDGKYIGNKASSSFVLRRRSFFQKIQDWMPMAFKVPEDMFLAAKEIACATYIFGPEVSNPTSSDELLVTTGANFINRKCLFTLVPGEQVLDTLAYHLTNEHKKLFKVSSMWYLPTIFSQLALSWTRSPDNLREQFANKYMDKVDNVSRIFVPIHDGNKHWFLMIVDMNKDRIFLLDSAKSTSSNYHRRFSVETMVIFIERMFSHHSFYNNINHLVPRVSKFKIIEPQSLLQQRKGSAKQ